MSVLVLGLTSCSKDDTQEPASIVGTWDQFQFVYVNKINGEEIIEDYTPNCSGKPLHIVFNSNGEGFYNSYSSSTCELDSYPILWSQSGQSLIIEYDNGEQDKPQVTQLDETTLKLLYSQGGEIVTIIYRRR
ncbi:lipocalin family protein [Flavobacterium sp. FZUC8N2.13]|uniref:Lipocalin family protein n=1 Tax=Flavobacterium zubiriense TaxID=3138075 RepID=A0ABV4T6S4_9FLAO